MKERRGRSLDLAALSAPSFLFAGYELAHRVLLPPFLTGQIKIEVGLAGLMILAVQLVEIVAATVFGALSDVSLSPRIGRRRFWMLLGAPIALAGTFGVFSAPENAGLLEMSGILFAMAIGWTMVNAAHGAWALEAATGLAGRSRVFAARTAAGILGYLTFSVLVAAAGSQLRHQVQLILAGLVIGVPLSTGILFWRVPDPQKPRTPFRMQAVLAPFALGLTSLTRIHLSALFALVGASSAVSMGGFVYLVRYGLGLPDSVGPILVVQSCATIIGLPVGIWLGRRFGPWRTLSIVFSADLAIALSLFFLPGGQQLPAYGWALAKGLFSGVDFMLLRALAGEELDAERTSDQGSRAGAYYATFHLAYNLANAVGTAALFAAYVWAGFDPSKPDQITTSTHVPLAVSATGGVAISLALLLLLAFRPQKRRFGSHLPGDEKN